MRSLPKRISRLELPTKHNTEASVTTFPLFFFLIAVIIMSGGHLPNTQSLLGAL